MSISTINSSITRTQNEIAALHKKMSLETKKEADCNSRIAQIERGITKTTSPSTLKSKLAETDRKKNEIARIHVKIADLRKKLSDKEGKLSKFKQDLLKEEEKVRKKQAAAEEKERRRLAELEKKKQREQLAYQKQLQAEIRKTSLMATEVKNSVDNVTLQSNVDYDLFISHASEDKDEFVRPLAEALENMGIKVWYDEFTLKVGDSLRKSIDHGLIKSKFGTVILSADFCSKNWTQYELDSMVAREMEGHKMILPIWHKITKDEVMNFSPALADKVALNTSIQSIQEIAEELKSVIKNT